MNSAVRIAHVSLTAHKAERLAEFYRAVFGFEDRRPPRRLTGKAVSWGNGLPDVGVQSFWLHPPEATQCFLEILQYDVAHERPAPAVNATGLGHIALLVTDIHKACADILWHGGAKQGEITDLGSPDRPILVVYMRDPEGNVLELEQSGNA
jgi:catechol 2,3-dioxygenase-like lactoylglutathione lyase family enzyme